MHLLILILLVWTAFLIVLLWACAATTWAYFRPASAPEANAPLLPMTVVKPVRGLDDAFIPGLEALARADPGKQLQILIVMESADDSAYAAAQQFTAAHPERDISLVISGPAKDRMGKMHNMIEALPHAKHPRVIFSDADVIITPPILAETSLAFSRGFSAIYAVPYHLDADNAGGRLMHIAFEHVFSIVALLYYAKIYNFYAGAWMAYTTEMLEKIGGLAPFAHRIADDYALGDAASKAGSRKYLLHARAGVKEGDSTFADTLRHLAKWAAIMHSCLPPAYALSSATDGTLIALIALGLSIASGWALAPASCLLTAIVLSRISIAVLLDAVLGNNLMPWLAYASMPLVDILSLALWLCGFRSTILWRGTRYRLSSGGRAEVLDL